MIATNRNSFSDTIDTTYWDMTRNSFVNIPVYFDQFHNHSYIVYNESPPFLYKVSHIEAFYADDPGCDPLMFSFQIDGFSYQAEESHRVVIDTAGIQN